MVANVPAHRRAHAFARALEERRARGTAPDRPEEPAERPEHIRMLALAGSLAEVPRPKLDSDVKAAQRARLIAAMEATSRADTASGGAAAPTIPEQRAPRRRGVRALRPRSRLSKNLVASGVTVTMAAGAFGGVAAASSDALPGDSLYGIKRSMEDVKLGMAGNDSDRGKLYLNQAATRLHEARRLMERDRSGPLDPEAVTKVRDALSGVRHDAAEGRRLLFAAYRRDGSLAPIQTLSAFSRAHRDSWATLRDRLPHQLGDVRDEVTSVLDAIDQEVAPLRPLLPSPSDGPESALPYTAPHSDRPDSQEPAPSASGGSPGDTDHGGSPEPSGSSPRDDSGLLGSLPPLLDVPGEDPNPPSPTTKGGRDGRIPEADVTVPPLFPTLPELGLDQQAQKEDAPPK